jgi:hypothetical protein
MFIRLSLEMLEREIADSPILGIESSPDAGAIAAGDPGNSQDPERPESGGAGTPGACRRYNGNWGLDCGTPARRRWSFRLRNCLCCPLRRSFWSTGFAQGRCKQRRQARSGKKRQSFPGYCRWES